MKKRIICIFAAIMLLTSLCACGNRQMFDTTYSYEKAVIVLPNGEIVEGLVSSWRDYEDGDQIQVVIDGTTYLVHSSNVALISD